MFTVVEVGIVSCFLISRQKYNMRISGMNSKNAVHTQLFFEFKQFSKNNIRESGQALDIKQILEDFEDIQDLRKAKAEEFNAPTRPLSQVLAEFTQS